MEQMYKKFYCEVCKTKMIFVQHEKYPNKYICINCHFTTSRPQTEIIS